MKGLSREARMLIDAAREGDDPSAADRKRVRAGLARKLAVGAAAGAVAATATHAAAGGVSVASSAAGSSVAAAGGVGAAGGMAAGAVAGGAIASGIGAKILVSVAIVGAMSAGTVSYVRHEAAKQAKTAVVAAEHTAAPRVGASRIAPSTPPSPAPVIPPVAARAVAPSAPPAPVIVPLPPTDSAPRAGSVTKSSSSPSSPTAPAAPVAPVATRSDLDVELALLQEAQGALRTNDGARALRLLDEHARSFPNGALAEESEAARVFALREVGRTEEARDVAARFLREHPRSPLAPRVSRAFEAEPSTF